MCDECGCGETTIKIEESVYKHNNKVAHDTWHELQDKGIFCVNIMGAPGCGKTSFIEMVSKTLDPKTIAVIQGDLESDVDKKRLEAQGIQTFQINTHSGCHLNGQLIKDALTNINLQGKEYLFIENVGNLVCPAGVKLGQHANIVLSATTEGSDKPKKYPLIFFDADLILITKYDLRAHVGFDQTTYLADLSEINKKVEVLTVSTKKEESWTGIVNWLDKERTHILSHTHEHHHKDQHSH